MGRDGSLLPRFPLRHPHDFPLLALPLFQPPLCSRVSRSTVTSFFPPSPLCFHPLVPVSPHTRSNPSTPPPSLSVPPTSRYILPSPLSLFSPLLVLSTHGDILPVSSFSFVALARLAHPSSSSLLVEIRPIAASCPSLRSISLSLSRPTLPSPTVSLARRWQPCKNKHTAIPSSTLVHRPGQNVRPRGPAGRCNAPRYPLSRSAA